IPSPIAGVLQEILAEEDDTVEVGGDLAVIGDSAEGGDSTGGDTASEEPAEQEAPAAEPEQEAAGEEASSQEPAEQEPAEREAPAQEAPATGADSGGSGSDAGDGETVTMPALGESVTEGTVTRWLKAEGDDVEVDEPPLEVS